MRRRDAILALLALGAAQRRAWAQPAPKLARIGVLNLASTASTRSNLEALRASLKDLGHVEGRTIEIDLRSADGRVERLPELAAQLVARNVAVIVAGGGNVTTFAAKKATGSIPIVMPGSVDAVESGLIDSLARPGGNITGLTVPAGLGAKQLELLLGLVPSPAKVAVLTRTNPAGAARRAQAKAIAQEMLRVAIDYVDTDEPEDLTRVLATLRATRPNAMIVGLAPMFFQQRDQILEFARAARIPVMYPFRDFVDAGGLISYSVNAAEIYRGVARYIDRILKGAKPADLPVEEPREFELVINMKSAKAIGLAVPQSLLLRANEVIQ